MERAHPDPTTPPRNPSLQWHRQSMIPPPLNTPVTTVSAFQPQVQTSRDEGDGFPLYYPDS